MDIIINKYSHSRNIQQHTVGTKIPDLHNIESILNHNLNIY